MEKVAHLQPIHPGLPFVVSSEAVTRLYRALHEQAEAPRI